MPSSEQATLNALAQTQDALKQYQYPQALASVPQSVPWSLGALRGMAWAWQAKALRYTGKPEWAQATLMWGLTPLGLAPHDPLRPLFMQQWLDIAQDTPACVASSACYTMAEQLVSHAPFASYPFLKGLTVLIAHQAVSSERRQRYLNQWLQAGGLAHPQLTQHVQASMIPLPWLASSSTMSLRALAQGNESLEAWRNFASFKQRQKQLAMPSASSKLLPFSLGLAPLACQTAFRQKLASLEAPTPLLLYEALTRTLWQVGNETSQCQPFTYGMLHALAQDLSLSHGLSAIAQAEWEHHRSALNDVNRWQGFLTYSTWHLQRFPHEPITACVLFWHAHLQHLQGKKEAAQSFYRQLLTQFPQSYFASRAWAYLEHTSSEAYPRAFVRTALPVDALPTVKDTMDAYLASRYKIPTLSRAWQALSPEVHRRLSAAYVQWVLPEASPLRRAWELSNESDERYPHWGMALTLMREGMEQLYTESHSADIKAVPSVVEALAYPVPPAFRPLWKRLNSPWVPLAMAITKEESSWNPASTSPVGAKGLMQLMPATAREIAQREGLSLNLTHPETNVTLGTRYLETLATFFHEDPFLMTAAYNAGPGAIQQTLQRCQTTWQRSPDLWQETCLVPETRFYLQKVFRTLWHYRIQSDTLSQISHETGDLLPRMHPMNHPMVQSTLRYLEDFSLWHTGQVKP